MNGGNIINSGRILLQQKKKKMILLSFSTCWCVSLEVDFHAECLNAKMHVKQNQISELWQNIRFHSLAGVDNTFQIVDKFEKFTQIKQLDCYHRNRYNHTSTHISNSWVRLHCGIRNNANKCEILQDYLKNLYFWLWFFFCEIIIHCVKDFD